MNTLYINTAAMPLVDYAGYGDISNIDSKEHNNSYCTMLYITGGTLYSSLSFARSVFSAELSEGSVIFIPPNTTYHLQYDGIKKLSFIYVNFYMDISDSEIRKMVLGKSAFPFHQNSQEVTVVYELPLVTCSITGSVLDKKIHDYIEFFSSSSRPTDIDINSRFYDIISECFKYNNSLHNTHRNLSEEIITYLNEHVTEQLNSSDMERQFYLTYKYMGTAFKKETGETILSYHTGLRMDYAKRLILTTSHSIDEISRILGYTDALYFSRVFKKYNGLSPQAFRKSGGNKPQ